MYPDEETLLEPAQRQRLCACSLAGFAAMLSVHSLQEQPEALRRCHCMPYMPV